ncbi:transmembrane protein 138-like [Centruroides sculpturatus]|uniref:transmembrane protein 138-like n=1 Tax=Centruroides sculpturatus TaxID=218467 RepID=UPI000C6E1B10|nr:transmembrane protein 138-like [Centruroides sculpturatus]
MLAEQFCPILSFQYFLLFLDLLINATSDYFKSPIVTQLVLFVIQDVGIIFCIMIIFLMFFNTYVFRAGLFNIIFAHFRMLLIIAASYLIISITYHAWSLSERWLEPHKYIWTRGFVTLNLFHKCCSVLYYYVYKRTALRIVDPRFYQDGKWLRKELGKR